MAESIIVALISGGVTLLGVLASNTRRQAVADTKIDELTREVREHNHFAKRMPVVEEQIKVINHRLEDLENYHK
jgi:hypothetical protein